MAASSRPEFNGSPKDLMRQLPDDATIWQSLKAAIASSSGFQRWQLEQQGDDTLNDLTLELRVQRYLRETLETLAY